MEKSTIYASAPKPPKQIRVEENPVETDVENQDLPENKKQPKSAIVEENPVETDVENQDSPENKEQPKSAITVMQPTAPKDSVVKLNTTAAPADKAEIDVAKNESSIINETAETAAPIVDTTSISTESSSTVGETILEGTPKNITEGDTSKAEEVVEPTTEEMSANEHESITAKAPEENAVAAKSDEPATIEAKPDMQNGAVETLGNSNETPSVAIHAAAEDTPTTEVPIQESADLETQSPNVDGPLEVEESLTTIGNTNEEAEPITTVEAYGTDEEPVTAIDSKQTIEEPINQEIKAAIEPKSEKVSRSGTRQKVTETEYEFENLKIPIDDELFQRQYYTMGEVATMFHANQSQIRFWENEFDILQPKKNKKGDRYFRPEDVKNLQVIHHLLRNRRFTIEGAREYLKSNKQRTQDTVSAIASLSQLKSFLTELKANL